MSEWVTAPVRGVSVRYVRRKREPPIMRLGRLLNGERWRNRSVGVADRNDVR